APEIERAQPLRARGAHVRSRGERLPEYPRLEREAPVWLLEDLLHLLEAARRVQARDLDALARVPVGRRRAEEDVLRTDRRHAARALGEPAVLQLLERDEREAPLRPRNDGWILLECVAPVRGERVHEVLRVSDQRPLVASRLRPQRARPGVREP